MKGLRAIGRDGTPGMDRPNLPPPPAVSPALAEFSARLVAESAAAVAALPAGPIEPDPADEYERRYGVLVDPGRWANSEPEPSPSYEPVRRNPGESQVHCECMTGRIMVSTPCWGPVEFIVARSLLHGLRAVPRCSGHAGIQYRPEAGEAA